MMHSSIGRAGVQWNIPVLSYFISVFSKSRSRGTGAMAGRPFLINTGGRLEAEALQEGFKNQYLILWRSYVSLAKSGISDPSLMDTDFLGGGLGWACMLLFI